MYIVHIHQCSLSSCILVHTVAPYVGCHHCRSNFSDFAFKYGRDERFKLVEKMREREQLFTDFIAELKRANKHKDEQKYSAKSKEDMVLLLLIDFV